MTGIIPPLLYTVYGVPAGANEGVLKARMDVLRHPGLQHRGRLHQGGLQHPLPRLPRGGDLRRVRLREGGVQCVSSTQSLWTIVIMKQ